MPSPPDGYGNQDIILDLGWSGGDPDGDSVTYDVYLEGFDVTPDLLVSEGQSVTSYRTDTLSTSSSYYWQIRATDQHGLTTVGPVWAFTTTSPPYAPGNPSPPDGSENQSSDSDLSWTSGDPNGDSVSFDVYFEADDSSPDALLCDGVTSTTCDPGVLSYGTQYYWYVVATDQHLATSTGPLWDFSTETPFVQHPVNASSP
jgi:hypothetical protein